MNKIKTLEALGFVPAFKGSQGGMLLERIEERPQHAPGLGE